MTAREWLDSLDAAHAKGTPGEWGVGNGTDVATGVKQTGLGSYQFRDEVCRVDDLRESDTEPEADAELIVAAVNALPELTARLRAVLDLADEAEADSVAPVVGYKRIRAAAEGDAR